MSIANQILPKVRKAVLDYGNTLILRQSNSTSTWNPDTQQIENSTTENDTIFKGAVDMASLSDERGTIQRGDLIITAVLDETPSTTGNIIYNNSEYGIVNINPLYFQDVLMVYEIVARRG